MNNITLHPSLSSFLQALPKPPLLKGKAIEDSLWQGTVFIWWERTAIPGLHQQCDTWYAVACWAQRHSCTPHQFNNQLLPEKLVWIEFCLCMCIVVSSSPSPPSPLSLSSPSPLPLLSSSPLSLSSLPPLSLSSLSLSSLPLHSVSTSGSLPS